MPPEEGTAAWRLRACPPDCRDACRRISGIERRTADVDPPAGGARGYAGAACAGPSSSSWGRRRSWTGAGGCAVRASRASRPSSSPCSSPARPSCVVSSGAIALGLGSLDRDVRPSDVPGLQAASAVGQGLLAGRVAARARRGGRSRGPGAADGRRRATAHELPECARDARGAAGMGRRPDRQRERLDGDRRDHVRRQRRARRAGRAPAARAAARPADRRRRPLHARPAPRAPSSCARSTTARCSPSSISTPPRRAASARAACARRSWPPRWRPAAASPA